MSYESAAPNAPNLPMSSEIFKTLADPTRRAIFEGLMQDGEQTVRALTERAGVSQPAVSRHLGVLKEAGLVHDRPQGRSVHYRADPQGLAPLMDWLRVYSAFWHERFDRLENVLAALDSPTDNEPERKNP